MYSCKKFLSVAKMAKTVYEREMWTATAKRTSANKMVLHVRFDSWYISLPSSAKQQLEMAKFYVFWSTRTAMANFSFPSLELNAVMTFLA